ncbi:hypothetical protein [Alkalihalobacillus deserti]|uniref:hypothetical protein n=1 Tax=Alkalihalobacillus deserti TaxID=2879466 RepID=UPI001D13D931|nr:hypothetical protein [Alkalihalobacillus deserti]
MMDQQNDNYVQLERKQMKKIKDKGFLMTRSGGVIRSAFTLSITPHYNQAASILSENTVPAQAVT